MASGQALSENLTRYFSWSATEVSLNPILLDKAQETYSAVYDERYGGFGQAPKFPSPSIQNFLMAFYYFTKNDHLKFQKGQRAFMMNMSTLRAMATGGIYDHIGGGFHRYSTDAKWHIPHFEKMLYDNAQLLENYLDDKILASWNGLMISAMSRAYQILDDERYLSAAVKSAKFIQKQLYDPKSKQLYRRWRQSESKIPGMASDYAFLTHGLIDLYEADFNPVWLDWAVDLADEQIRLFYDREHGGFFMTRTRHDKNLIIRVKEISDSVIPSANSSAVLNFLRLSRYTDKGQYAPIAEKTMKTVLARIQHPTSAPKMLTALIVSLSKPIEIIIAGDRNREDTRRLLKSAHSFYNPAKIVMLVDNATTRKMLADNLPFIAFIKPVNGKAAAYVCTDRSCSLPVTDPGALAEVLESTPQKSGHARPPAKTPPLSTGP